MCSCEQYETLTLTTAILTLRVLHFSALVNVYPIQQIASDIQVSVILDTTSHTCQILGHSSGSEVNR